MNKLWLIIKREYLVRVRKKTFIIATILTPIAILAIYSIPILIFKFSGGEQQKIAMKDDSGVFERKIADSDRMSFELIKEGTKEDLVKNYQEEGFDGVLYIPEKSLYNDLYVEYYSEEQVSVNNLEFIEKRLETRIERHKMTLAGIDQSKLDSLETRVIIEEKSQKVNEAGEVEEVTNTSSAGLSTMIGMVMGMFMYFVLFIYGMMVMRSVMEEKINRVVEVMISSVKPFQLMLGKVVGVGMVGLTQLGIWIFAIYLMQLFLLPIIIGLGASEISSPDAAQIAAAGGEDAMENISQLMEDLGKQNWGLLIPSLIFYFLGGYFIYASMFAAIGSAIGDDLGESQSLTLPVSLPIIIAFFITFSLVDDPNNPIAVFGSIFPLFSPIVMPARMAFDPPVWQIILSAVVMVASVIFFIWLSSRIYRVGILMYGKKVSFKELGKWLFYRA